ncbi:MAG: glucose-6-phosphate isomerase [Vampirovibrionia bacterium]
MAITLQTLTPGVVQKDVQTKINNTVTSTTPAQQSFTSSSISANSLKANFTPISFGKSLSGVEIDMKHSVVGHNHAGIDTINFDKSMIFEKERVKNAVEKLYGDRNTPGAWLKWIDLAAKQRANVQKIQNFVDNNVKNKFDDVVVLGIGGSSLGAKALITALADSEWNAMSKEQRNGLPRIHFIENIDPDRFEEVVSKLDMNKTLINVVSKSGKTPETSATFLHLREAMKNVVGEAELKNHIVAITDNDPKKSILKNECEKNGYPTFVVPDDVGGRFSVLSDVGLLPAAMAGIDIDQLLKGAEDMTKACSNTADLKKNPAASQALAHVINYRQDRQYSVLTPYSDKLALLSDWYAQLWGESLGKKMDADNKEINLNHSPIKAVGAIDQHSQLQLWREGKSDKVHTIITIKDFDKNVPITKDPENVPDALSYMRHNSLNDLIREEAKATKEVLVRDGHPVISVEIPKLDAYNVGQLMQMFMMKTAIVGELQGLGVNTFLQPAVEDGKIIATKALADLSAEKASK